MVIIKNSIRAATIPIAFTSFLVLDGCKKEDNPVPDPVTKTDLLVGDWKATEVDGYDYTNSEYSFFFKFQSAGDFEFCYEYASSPAANFCEGGTWKWKDSNETSILFPDIGNNESQFDIVILTSTNLEGSLVEGSYSTSLKFIKVK
jgi:lipocalin-like protein